VASLAFNLAGDALSALVGIDCLAACPSYFLGRPPAGPEGLALDLLVDVSR
jgi:hypothetical protein